MRQMICIFFLISILVPAFTTTLDEELNKTLKGFIENTDSIKVIGIGSFTFKDENVGSEFSAYLSEKFIFTSQNYPSIEIADRSKMDEIVSEMKLAFTGLIDEDSALKPGMLKSINSIVSGRFYPEIDTITVFLDFLDLETGITSNSFELKFLRKDIPVDISITPSNYNDAKFVLNELADISQSRNGNLALKVWTKRGDGGIYYDGEDLTVNIYASENCFLKVYHIDVNGSMQLIFPNPYHSGNFITGGKIYKIPEKSYPFSFTLGKPYGTEFIKVIASSTQFKDIEEPFSDLGKASTEILTRGLSVKKKETVISESTLNYTIVE